MSGITLHKTKGVNPHMGLCPRCGKDNGEILLIGSHDSVYQCPNCDVLVYGGSAGKGCPKCNAFGLTFVRKVEDNEKIPSGLCKECETEAEQMSAIVAAGGIYVKCTKCGMQGVLPKEHPMAVRVREHSKVAAPNPIGLELNDCKQHGVG